MNQLSATKITDANKLQTTDSKKPSVKTKEEENKCNILFLPILVLVVFCELTYRGAYKN